jgi:transposase
VLAAFWANDRANWIAMNVPFIEEIHATIRIHMKEATIELDVPWSIDLPSSCRVPKKVKKTKSNSKINFYCIFWSYLTFTINQ